MSKVKLLVTDLDGTLVGPDRELTEEMLRAAMGLRERGIRLVIATGRMFRSARRYTAQLYNEDLPLIAYNGAWVAVPATGEVVFRRSLPGELAQRLVARLAPYHVQAFLDDELYVRELNERAQEYARNFRVEAKVGDLEVLAERGFSKLQVIDATSVIHELSRELMAEGWEVTIASSAGHFLEITAPGVNKGEALVSLAAAWGIPVQETMAMGDGDNDLPMFRQAGRTVAIADGSAAARQAADEVWAREDLPRLLGSL